MCLHVSILEMFAWLYQYIQVQIYMYKMLSLYSSLGTLHSKFS